MCFAAVHNFPLPLIMGHPFTVYLFIHGYMPAPLLMVIEIYLGEKVEKTWEYDGIFCAYFSLFRSLFR